ncbi:hypothetical protein [Kitasatospora sp. NPDC059327]|uniref:hypothetical protein n=1 Tax=Kitasatospora sp. NPDC059327 TaxID=3346803 RepID=UPI0036736C0E
MAVNRRTAVAVVVAALALTATACNNDEKSTGAASAAPTTAAAAQPTSAAPSATPEPTKEAPAKLTPAAYLKLVTEKTGSVKSAKITEEILTGGATITATGTIGWSDGLQGDLSMDMSQLPVGQQMAKLTGSKTVPIRYLKDGMYLRLGGEVVEAVGGRHWLHYSYADMAAMNGATADQLKQADPVEGVRSLIASGKVAEAGQETVNGKPATHYTGQLTVDEMTAAAGSGVTDEQVQAMKKKLKTAGISSEQIDVWVDADNLVVKRTEQADTKAGPFKVTVGYSDYGTAVSATAPDQADVVEFAEIAKQAKGGAAG